MITPGGRPGDARPLGKGKRRLSNYEREVAHALIREGHSKSEAIQIARGVIDKAAATGRWGKGKAKASVRAGAVASVAQRGAIKLSVVDLASRDGHHIAGTPDTYRHGWVPIAAPHSGRSKERTAYLIEHPQHAVGADFNDDEKEQAYEAAQELTPYAATPLETTSAQSKAVQEVLKRRTDFDPTPPPGSEMTQFPLLGGDSRAVSITSPSFQGPDWDKHIASKAEMDSVREEALAQATATEWFNHDGDGDTFSGAGHSPEANFWSDYQDPSKYGQINDLLRGQPDPRGGAPFIMAKNYLNEAKAAFAEGGYTTQKPMTVFRGLRGTDTDWTKILQPGSTFVDHGMVSTTAFSNFAEGWVTLGPHGEPDATDPTAHMPTIVEIRMPKGTRIMGGSTQFIETMLPPDTKIKVVSNEIRTATDSASPLGGDDLGVDYKYHHVIADLIP